MAQDFACDKCNCVDQKELAGFQKNPGRLYCSFCNSGTWHGLFPREKYNPEIDHVCNRANNLGLEVGR